MTDEASHRWQVQLEGHVFDLEDVAGALQSQRYVLQQHDDEQWYLSGPPLDKKHAAGDARKMAEQVIRDVNAVLLVRNSKYKPVTVGSTVREGNNQHSFIQCKGAELRLKTHAALVDAGGKQQPSPPFEREGRWLEAADEYAAVRDVLDLLSSDRDNKYWRAYELIKDDCGGDRQKVRELLGWSKSKFEGCTETLNAARHETPNRTPRISLKEAEELAREMIGVWLDDRAHSHNQ